MTRPRDIADSINRINSSAADATAMTIDSSENVGIGTTSPSTSLDVVRAGVQPLRVESSSGTEVAINMVNTGGNVQLETHSGNFNIDADAVGIGTTSPTSYANGQKVLVVEDSANPAIAISDTGQARDWYIIGFGAGLGIRYAVGGGSGGVGAATSSIFFKNDGDIYTGSKDDQNFDADGVELRAGGVTTITVDNNCPLFLNRRSSDGELIRFYQGGNEEGKIWFDCSTVSYNGGHLSRWSQLTNGTKDTSIVKGTVMTNLDQMAVWSHDAVAATYYVDGDELPEGVSVGDEKTPAKDAYTEENEQLNCMAVSSIEGDTNVAGVFVNWDNDDDFNDMNIAMTGDMVIRIAQGTTVKRGDLLMSAGDGTAKPQGDDIVRNKTIAKVTSTNVSHTYDDGS